MYDLPELREATDALWSAIAALLDAAGTRGAPPRLERGMLPTEVWRDEGLLLGQTCGYPLVTDLDDRVRVVATPLYRAEGCVDSRYRSAVLVPMGGDVATVAELAASRVAVNALDSHSGMNALRALVAPHSNDGRFFAERLVTGSHRASIGALREGHADVAAIDAVALALLRDVAPAELEGLEVLAWTDAAPCLPYVTTGRASDGDVLRLRHALFEVAADASLAPVRDRLRIEGFSPADRGAYDVIAEMRERAAQLGYPTLR